MRFIPLILVSALAVFYGLRPQQSILIFDKECVQGQFIRQLAEARASESQVEQSTRRFNEVLNKVLAEIARQKKAIILSKKEVLVGGIEITDAVVLKLHDAMRSNA